jgi:hypothetical protein
VRAREGVTCSPVRTRKSDIPDWLELTHSPDPRERRKALQALCPCELKSRVSAVWERVLEMAVDPDAAVRRSTLHVLCDGSPALYHGQIVRVLESRYQDPDRRVRRAVRKVLANHRHTGNLNIL